MTSKKKAYIVVIKYTDDATMSRNTWIKTWTTASCKSTKIQINQHARRNAPSKYNTTLKVIRILQVILQVVTSKDQHVPSLTPSLAITCWNFFTTLVFNSFLVKRKPQHNSFNEDVPVPKGQEGSRKNGPKGSKGSKGTRRTLRCTLTETRRSKTRTSNGFYVRAEDSKWS